MASVEPSAVFQHHLAQNFSYKPPYRFAEIVQPLKGCRQMGKEVYGELTVSLHDKWSCGC